VDLAQSHLVQLVCCSNLSSFIFSPCTSCIWSIY
jgi:hypothetical protein